MMAFLTHQFLHNSLFTQNFVSTSIRLLSPFNQLIVKTKICAKEELWKEKLCPRNCFCESNIDIIER